MSHEFKPGDKVRTKTIVRTVRCVDLNGPDPLLHFEDNLVARPQNVELVEPCVSHREIREVCERHIAWYSHPSIQLALKQLMHALTEEVST
jgi:hypothetical protein